MLKEPGYFAKDALASVVVFLVALPLCMGIAIASGAPPAAGLMAGIIGGLVVGFFAGSPLQVSGPAAGLAVIVWELIRTHGLAVLGPIVLIAGLFQIAAGVGKLGRWFQAVPPSVIFGMLAGIGVLIFASQFHVMVDDKPKATGLLNLVSIPAAVWKGIVPQEDLPHEDAARLGVLTIATILLWQGAISSRFPKLKIIPGTLVGVLVATIVANVIRAPVAYVTLPDSLLGGIRLPTREGLALMLNPRMIGAAAALAVVASAETLLCASATDRMHTGARTNYDREMLAQGIGNVLCGVVGALPMTGVIVRSAANVEAGGKTRRSAILHGAWLLAAVVAIPFVLRLVPVSALAALLVFTGYKLMRQNLRSLLERGGQFELVIYFATIIGIVTTDLLKGVVFGLVLAIGKIVWMFTNLRVRLVSNDEQKKTTVFMSGSATFLRLPELTAALAKVPGDHEVEIQFPGVNYIDHACFDALAAWEEQHRARGGIAVLNWAQVEFLSQRPTVSARPSTATPRPVDSKKIVPPAEPAATATSDAVAVNR